MHLPSAGVKTAVGEGRQKARGKKTWTRQKHEA